MDAHAACSDHGEIAGWKQIRVDHEEGILEKDLWGASCCGHHCLRYSSVFRLGLASCRNSKAGVFTIGSLRSSLSHSNIFLYDEHFWSSHTACTTIRVSCAVWNQCLALYLFVRSVLWLPAVLSMSGLRLLFHGLDEYYRAVRNAKCARCRW